MNYKGSRRKMVIALLSALVLVAISAIVFPNFKSATKSGSDITNEEIMANINSPLINSVSASVEPVETNIVSESENEDEGNNTIDIEETQEETTEVEEETVSEYDGKFMANVDEGECLNIRTAADENSELVGKIYRCGGGTVIEEQGDWTKISSGSCEGYVSTQYIVTDEDAQAFAESVCTRYAVITGETVRIRKETNAESEVLGLAEIESELTVLDEVEGWAKVAYDGEEGYVAEDLVDVYLDIQEAESVEEEKARIEAEEAEKAAEEEAARKAAEEEAAEEAAAAEAKAEAEAEAQAQTAAESTTSNEVQTTTVQTSGYSAGYDDAYLLACLVQAEAGSEPYEGKLAVANVVINRVNAGYGSSISEVIYAPGQFSPARNGSLNRILSSGPSAECVQAANAALAGTNNVPNYRNFRALRSANTSSYSSYSVIGSQVFY